MSRSNQKPKPEPIRDPNWVFPWGKFKGESISDVLYCTPDYIDWLMKNTDFDVHDDLFQGVEERYRDGLDTLYKRDLEKD